MPNPSRIRSVLLPVLLLSVAPGCQAYYRYQPISVLALDAETKMPIAGAQVRISYPLMPAVSVPVNSSGTTGTDGVVLLRAAASSDAGPLVEVTASGYLFEEKSASVEVLRAPEATQRVPTEGERSARLVLELYAEPPPTIELVLPTGYRGVVKVDVQTQDQAPATVGQRCFSYEVPASGVVQITGPALLRRVLPAEFRARFTDGTALSREPKDMELGIWCVQWEEKHLDFWVGTQRDYESYRPSLRAEEILEHRPPTSGKSEGRGRGSRRGNRPPADSNSEGMSP
ncbi:hypothetical protein AYO44_01005 [Planctomycetaceae bacterium SCGC AG-212-F19]|nr:hypothetical protein AYO44_01005 [Planctomycetaceae bacterium SCGC AG-212-F19]